MCSPESHSGNCIYLPRLTGYPSGGHSVNPRLGYSTWLIQTVELFGILYGLSFFWDDIEIPRSVSITYFCTYTSRFRITDYL